MPSKPTVTTQSDSGAASGTSDKATASPEKKSNGQTNLTLPFLNELEDYTSYNYVFTLSCLDDEEISAPDDTYRKNGPKMILLRSGGGVDGVVTEPESEGSVEYFIDNVEVDSIIAPNRKSRHTNATRIKFQVVEPYSMGIFIQELKLASKLSRGPQANYLENAYLLTVEFKGWDDKGNYLEKKHLKRQFPFKIVNINFNVTEGGSIYDIDAIPWVEQAATDTVQGLKTDVKLIGSTVKEMLQTGLYSLSTILNSREQEKRLKGEVTTADEYVIYFPKEPKDKIFTGSFSNEGTKSVAASIRSNLAVTKTKLWKQSISEVSTKPGWFDTELDDKDKTILGVMIKRSNLGEFARFKADERRANNIIGRAKIVDNILDGVKRPFSRPRFVELDDKDGIFERSQIQVDDNITSLTFKAGTTIQEIIEEVILSSHFGRTVGTRTPDQNGMIDWFKIDLEVYNLKDEEQEIKQGRPPRLYVYKVLTYKTHVSRYSPVTQPSLTEALKSQCLKEYNYIYTGKNDNILDFDINFNRAYFLANTPFAGANKGTSLDANASRRSGTEEIPKALPASGGVSDSKTGNTVWEESYKQGSGLVGGGGLDKVTTSVARDFNDAILNSTVDLVTTSLTIWGDPYYIIDSGFGNYLSVPSEEFINLNADGSLNHHDSEVHILLNFRTPFDYPHKMANNKLDPAGFMDFYKDGTYSPQAFSGVYQVTQVLNSFSEGQFTQRLSMIRIRNQEKTDTKKLGTTEAALARSLESTSEFQQKQTTIRGRAGGASA